MTVLGHGIIFQPVLASLPYTQTCTYNNGAIVTLQNISTSQIFHKKKLKKRTLAFDPKNKFRTVGDWLGTADIGLLLMPPGLDWLQT